MPSRTKWYRPLLPFTLDGLPTGRGETCFTITPLAMSHEFTSDNTEFALDERLAFLERHVQQQDREVYMQSEQIRRLQEEVKELRKQLRVAKSAGQGEHELPADERPPHY